MASLQLQAYEILKQKFGEKDASIVIDFIETKIGFEVEANIKNVATKVDLSELKLVLTEDISKLRSELKEDISGLRSELKEDISGLRSELTKTIYIVGLVQFLAIVGSIVGILSFIGKH